MKIGFLTALFLIFLVLKLTSVIAWAWWAVFLPLIIGVGLWVFVVGSIIAIKAFGGK